MKRRSYKKNDKIKICRSEKFNPKYCHRKLFIAVPKTGGTSISDNKNVTTIIHSKLKYFKERDYIFVVLRDPFSRFESAFWHHKTLDHPDNYWGDYSKYSVIKNEFKDPNDFISKILNVKSKKHKIAVNCLKYIHFIPQSYYITDDNGNINKYINKIIIYSEDLSKNIKKYVGVDIGYINKTPQHNNVVLTHKSKNFIKEYYKKDFEMIERLNNSK